MNKNDLVYVRHIVDSVELIESFTKKHSELSFIEDEESVSATAYQVQIIGEAAAQLSELFKSEYPEIPWRDIIDTRHKIVHHYMKIDPEILWDITLNDLPKLKLKLLSVIDES